MIHLTVGYVAGLIAFGIFAVRIIVPNVLTFILSAILHDKNTAATWTVAGRALHNSRWPQLLRSDATRLRGVRKGVLLVTNSMSLLGFLTALAGVVTPLGLYETLVATPNIQTPFKYLKDLSPFGYGTPPRSPLPFNRICSRMPCPFSNTVAIETSSSDSVKVNYPYGYNVSIPDIISEIYSSGTNNGTTISNFFDIQWRRYLTTNQADYNNGSTYLIGDFHLMQSMILDNAVRPVEGLIVDMINGGIGFRNHTIPPGFHYGAAWEEDLLFIEPETVCIDTNVTIDFSIALTPNYSTSVVNPVLTDRGGFVNLNQSYPYLNLTDPQKNPDLARRAYKAAMLTNFYTMLYYNVTNPHNDTTGRGAFAYMNSHIGQTFQLPTSLVQDQYLNLQISNSFDSHLNFLLTGMGNSTGPAGSIAATNPFGVNSLDWFGKINIACSGAGGLDYANITNIGVVCGLMRSIPTRVDDGPNFIFSSGSKWSQSLYSCATATKATIKTVSFIFNGTDTDLSSLIITDIHNKVYPDEASKPLWGVENTDNAYTLNDLNVIWGLISPQYENHPNVSSVRQESLYLPFAGIWDYTPGGTSFENLPGNDFCLGSVGGAYHIGDSSNFDYSGKTNMAMWARWQNESQTPASAKLIPNLVFTDYAAAAVVGTKGVLGPGNSATKNLVPLPVTPTEPRIRYHWPFAIPALLVVLFMLISCGAAFIALLFGRGSFSKLRAHLHQTSPGRILTTFLFRDLKGLEMESKEWSRSKGKYVIDMSGGFPTTTEEVMMWDGKERRMDGMEVVGSEEQRFLGGQGGVLGSPGFGEDGGRQGGYLQPVRYGGERDVSPVSEEHLPVRY